MFVFELRWLLFGLLVLFGIVSISSMLLTRRYERKKLPATLFRSLQPLLTDAPLGVLIVDSDYVYHYANPYARRLFRLPVEQGRLPSTTWASDLQAEIELLQQKPQELGRYRTMRLAHQSAKETPDQPEQTIRCWTTQWENYIMLFVADITQQQQAMQQAHFLLNDLSHELRTPLATLQTHIAVLQLSTISDEVHSQSLEIMKGEAQQLSRLINHSLELGRLESGSENEISPINILSLVEQVVAQMASHANELGATISIKAASALPIVLGQPDRLKQVFINLIDNGLKYGGSDNQLIVTLQPLANDLLCKVCDTGPGISSEHLPHISRRFYRAAPATIPGNGLGLALVTEILRQHQSQLKIESKVANPNVTSDKIGTCISFTLPIHVTNSHSFKTDDV